MRRSAGWRRGVVCGEWGGRAASALAAALVATVAVAADGPLFEDASDAWGLDFVHFNGMSGAFYFPEMTGQGGALFDYDGDGDLDAYLVQGEMLAGEDLAAALFPTPGVVPHDRLLRNDLAPGPLGAGVPRFVDVSEASGIAAGGYGMGVATGDYDGDGAVDLYVTNYGPNRLLRNRGDGTFEDVTESSGTGDAGWGTSAAFVDLDGDGRLDLYVVNYVDFDVERNPACYAVSSRRDYCGPSAFPPQADRLFRNLGDGRFEDVTRRLLRGYEPGPGLGVTAADFDGDGSTDLYVANDGAVNQLWLRRADGTFSDEALLAGVALNRRGQAEASMGVDAGDFDQDGDEDLFLTHLMGESNTLYVNEGGGLFEDRSLESGLASVSLPYTAFGTSWVDYDNDSRLDLMVLNGAVKMLEEQAASGEAYPLKQPNQLFHNRGGSFVEVSAAAGPAFALAEVSRGAAFGDVDNDGAVDVLVLNNNGPARLLRNRAAAEAGWLGVVPRTAAGAPAVGARVRVERGDAATLWRRVDSTGGYCSADDPRVVAGLGASAATAIEVDWPGGGGRRLLAPRAGVYMVLDAGRVGDR